MQVILWIVGKTARNNEWIACALEGKKWLFLNTWATVFGLFQTMTVMMQTVMSEKIFFVLPKEMGFFDDVNLVRKRTRKQLGISKSMVPVD